MFQVHSEKSVAIHFLDNLLYNLYSDFLYILFCMGINVVGVVVNIYIVLIKNLCNYNNLVCMFLVYGNCCRIIVFLNKKNHLILKPPPNLAL